MKRKLFLISGFTHLIKNVRNGFGAKGYLTPSSGIHSGIIKEAWEADRDNVALKAMPNITSASIKPNCFEKMKVDLAFQLFGDKVIKGMFVHNEHDQSTYRTVRPTKDFIKQINRLIRIRSS
ncbi:hypothetical protein HPB48_026136 [Haemaphysalis longicornis]|uniref:Transposable element P transposase-like GTP-binding insertion domain-containing protein n=1 Tax=Haemaphysalis longicornis TaxID=44386 RepID=A0A9J6H0D2_HAELO|nr:hypothetical protein HPB48_026136 [Haemaphysalis longicornis]